MRASILQGIMTGIVWLSAGCLAVSAADVTWTGNADALWETVGNWSPGIPTGTDNTFFPATVPATGSTITLTGIGTANNVYFNNSYRLTGGTLEVNVIHLADGCVVTLESQLDRGSVGGGNIYGPTSGSATLILDADNSSHSGTYMDVRPNVTVSMRDGKGLPGAYFNVWGGAVELWGGVTMESTSKIVYLSSTTGVLSSAEGDNAWNGPVRLHYNSGERTINVETGSSLTLGQGISRSESFEHDLHKTGEGTLIIAASSSYFGQTFIDAGVVNIRHGSALGTGGHTTTVADGAALEIQDGIAVGQGLTLNGAGVAGSGSLRSLGGTNTWNGNIAMNAATIGVDSGVLTLSGQMSGSGAFAKTGAGMLVLTGDNSYAGPLTVETGTVNIRHDHALGAIGQGTTVAAGATLEVQGGITVGDGLSLHGLGLADAGALRSLSGDNVWNGDVSLDSTRIAVDSDTLTITGQLSGSSGLHKAGAGTLVLTAASTYTGETVVRAGRLRLAGGHDRLSTAGTVWLQEGTLELDGQNQTISKLTIAGSGRVELDGGAMLTASTGDFWNSTNAITGTGRFIKTGTGYLTFGIANADYTGGTFIDNGKLWLYQGDNKLPVAGDVTIAGPGLLDLAHSNTPGATQTIGGLFGEGKVSIGVAGKAVTFIVGNGDRPGNFSGTIQDGSGIMSLTKTGTETMVLAGDNTYSGLTSVLEGTLQIDGTVSGAVMVDGGTLTGLGAVGGTVTVHSDGTHSPGASVGAQVVGGEVWNPGGTFRFEINDAAGVAGGPDGWDLLTVENGGGTGTLDLSGLSASEPFTIEVVSLADAAAGVADNFISTQPYEWLFASYEELAGAFSPELFTLDTTGFTNNTGAGHFGIATTQDGLAIVFVPEPGSAAMVLVCIVLLLCRRRK